MTPFFLMNPFQAFQLAKKSFSSISPNYAPTLTRRGDEILARFDLTDFDLCRSSFIVINEIRRMICALLPEARIERVDFSHRKRQCRVAFTMMNNDFCSFLRDTRDFDACPTAIILDDFLEAYSQNENELLD